MRGGNLGGRRDCRLSRIAPELIHLTNTAVASQSATLFPPAERA
jgi:hypothetical protein